MSEIQALRELYSHDKKYWKACTCNGKPENCWHFHDWNKKEVRLVGEIHNYHKKRLFTVGFIGRMFLIEIYDGEDLADNVEDCKTFATVDRCVNFLNETNVRFAMEILYNHDERHIKRTVDRRRADNWFFDGLVGFNSIRGIISIDHDLHPFTVSYDNKKYNLIVKGPFGDDDMPHGEIDFDTLEEFFDYMNGLYYHKRVGSSLVSCNVHTKRKQCNKDMRSLSRQPMLSFIDTCIARALEKQGCKLCFN